MCLSAGFPAGSRWFLAAAVTARTPSTAARTPITPLSTRTVSIGAQSASGSVVPNIKNEPVEHDRQHVERNQGTGADPDECCRQPEPPLAAPTTGEAEQPGRGDDGSHRPRCLHREGVVRSRFGESDRAAGRPVGADDTDEESHHGNDLRQLREVAWQPRSGCWPREDIASALAQHSAPPARTWQPKAIARATPCTANEA